ncbi:MAG: fasciclin domain-containing protein [candidate division SR1 bacterium]|nr:fasciclin domain-containing protein [candidate division SR1 bacterium]
MASSNSQNIVQIASSDNTFSTLVAAVKAAGLVETLSSTGPFTLLAPNNEAFSKIPSEVLNKLLLPINKEVLVKILTYHVISGEVDSSAIITMDSADTVEGSSITIATNGSTVVLNGNTKVLKADIMASNGIIHCIDSVLIPSGLDLSTLK